VKLVKLRWRQRISKRRRCIYDGDYEINIGHGEVQDVHRGIHDVHGGIFDDDVRIYGVAPAAPSPRPGAATPPPPPGAGGGADGGRW
jgi:hypothetical protein